MSGQQIGTVVGGVVGAFLAPYTGGASIEWGMAIGGLIGGAVDPTKIYGPHIGQGQQQSSTDGVPIAWIQGTAKVAGCLIWAGPRREVEVDNGGKGSGTEQVTYEAHQSFAIMVCESSQIRGSLMSSILLVEQDGKIVYDSRPESNFSEASAKWKANVDFMFGGEDQLPHPTMEADTGVGSTPAYRGRLVVVFKDFNLSPFGGRIPTYLFTVSSSGGLLIPPSSDWKSLIIDESDGNDYSGVSVDDSDWDINQAPFASDGTGKPNDPLFGTQNTAVPIDSGVWMRNHITMIEPPETDMTLVAAGDDQITVWVNGHLIGTAVWETDFTPTTFTIPKDYFVAGDNVIAAKGIGWLHLLFTYFDLYLRSNDEQISLSQVVNAIALRGNLQANQFDSSDLSTYSLYGYPIATQCSAADALNPVLQATFAFGTKVDGKLLFKFYGENASITIDDDDAVINDASGGAIQKTTRNQATEFPRKIVGSYIDPTQNYNTVTQQVERLAQTVIATGETSIQIPLAIAPSQAVQAVDKAIKVAYATLEGTIQLSVPYATSNADYLKLVAGEPFICDAKRWVIDEIDIGINYLNLQGRYDRQSAYQSNVQPINGNAPKPPTSMYSGPTDMMVMNLPSLRTQDTYGVYVAVRGIQSSWRGCTIQVSYDNKQSWQNAVTATLPSVMGEIVSDSIDTADSAETIVNAYGGQISSVTDEQMNANANALAILLEDTASSGVAEIRQAQYAALQSDGDYLLTGQRTGLNGTTAVIHSAGEKFTMLNRVYFIPIDLSFKGKTLYFRAVGFGEVAEQSTIMDIVYSPDTTVIVDGGEIT